jgi:hypothetical protein
MPRLRHITGAADLAPEGQPGSWVSDAAREKFMAAYERVFALWPQPCEEFDIDTATATTRVHPYRPRPGAEPVVLLHGAEVAVVPGSHGGFNRIGELNDPITAFIKAHASDPYRGGKT